MNETITAPKPTVKVGQQNIDEGVKQSSKKCMIAGAIRDSIPGATAVSVDRYLISWSDREAGLRYTYPTPRKIGQVLALWDEGATIPPFSFRLTGGAVSPANRRLSPAPARRPPRNKATRAARTQAVEKAVKTRIRKDKHVPSSRSVARDMGLSDDRSVRERWDQLTAEGRLPSRERARPFVATVEAWPEEPALGMDRVFGARRLAAWRTEVVRHG